MYLMRPYIVLARTHYILFLYLGSRNCFFFFYLLIDCWFFAFFLENKIYSIEIIL